MCRKGFSTILWCLFLTTALHAQVRHIFYDDGIPAAVDQAQNAFVAVRFTPSAPLTVIRIEFMVINESGSAQGCQVWISDTRSGSLRPVGYVPGPLPDRTWIQLDLATPYYVGDRDFFVIVQQPGGPYHTAGWWIPLDAATTTRRTQISYDGQTYTDITTGDALIRIMGKVGPPQDTEITAGITWSLSTASANTALIWTPTMTLGHLENIPTADEILVQGRSLSHVQGIVYSPTGLQALIWTEAQVFLRRGVMSTADEVRGPGGGPLSNVRGVVFSPEGGRALIWTNTQVLMHTGVMTTADEVRGPGGPLTDVRGIAFSPDGGMALIWTGGQVFLHRGVMTTADEVRAQNQSIGNVQGIVFSPETGSSKALIWTDARVLMHRGVMTTTDEIRAQGNSISVVQGIVFSAASGAAKALIWTDARVLMHRGVMTTADEIRKSGGSIAHVKGIACAPDGARELIWTESQVWMQRGVLTTVQEVLNQGASLGNVQGITYSAVTGTLPSEALIWTPARVLAQKGVLAPTDEVLEGGNSIGGVRGIVFCPGSGGTSSEALIWTAARVLRHMPVSPMAEELLAQGRSISSVQGILWAVSEALIMTPTQVFAHMAITPTAQEVTLAGGSSIVSFDPTQVSNVQVVVHHQGLLYGDGGEMPFVTQTRLSGAGMVGQPALSWVNYAGSSTGAAKVPSSASPALHATIIGAAPFDNSSLILGPDPVPGVVAGNAMKLFGGSEIGPVGPVLQHGSDIGTTGGSDFHISGVYTIVADGLDIWLTWDQFHYVYTSITGDFELSARVYDLENTDPWAKAGVMARESLDAGSQHAFMCVTPQDGEGRFAFQNRSTGAYGQSSSLHTQQGQVRYPINTWVKIKREGDIFTGYISVDGHTWQTFPGMFSTLIDGPNPTNPVVINMPQTIYVGLAVTSHSDGVFCTAHFDGVALQR